MNRKIAKIREEIVKITHGVATGLYLWGPPGIGKSHNVERMLEENAGDKHYVILKGSITPKGLFQKANEYCDSIIVCDDNIDIRNKDIRKILLPLLERRDGTNRRVISWNTAREDTQFVFTGGIVIVNNYPLPKDTHGRAIADRVANLKFELTHTEICEVVKIKLKDGYKGIPYKEMTDILNRFSKQCKKIGKPFSIRLFFDKIAPHHKLYLDKIVDTKTEDFIEECIGEMENWGNV